jgi:hypothetical protein
MILVELMIIAFLLWLISLSILFGWNYYKLYLFTKILEDVFHRIKEGNQIIMTPDGPVLVPKEEEAPKEEKDNKKKTEIERPNYMG